MKDLEKIKSEDLGCQVQDANPGNFAIEQEVAQLVAEKSDLKADKLSVTVKALIGKNFGEWFRQHKSLERVKSQGFYVPDDDENPANQGGNGGSNSEEIG